MASAIADTDCMLLEIDEHAFRGLENVKPLAARCIREVVIGKIASNVRDLIERVAD